MRYKVLTDEDKYILSFEHTGTYEDTIVLDTSSMDMNHLNCYKVTGAVAILDTEKYQREIDEEQRKAQEPTELETISAQVLYTAVMTDTLIEN